jgi:hypothetical protein
LPAPAIVIVLTRAGGQHIQQHPFDRLEHADDEIVTAFLAIVQEVGRSKSTHPTGAVVRDAR